MNTSGPIVVMGVSGAGKTTIARMLATTLAVQFIDADDLHSDAARAKMAAAHPLTDADPAAVVLAAHTALGNFRDPHPVVYRGQ